MVKTDSKSISAVKAFRTATAVYNAHGAALPWAQRVAGQVGRRYCWLAREVAFSSVWEQRWDDRWGCAGCSRPSVSVQFSREQDPAGVCHVTVAWAGSWLRMEKGSWFSRGGKAQEYLHKKDLTICPFSSALSCTHLFVMRSEDSGVTAHSRDLSLSLWLVLFSPWPVISRSENNCLWGQK